MNIAEFIYSAVKAVPAVYDHIGERARWIYETHEAQAVKTYEYYRRAFVSSVNALYNDKITVNEFVDRLSTLVYNQLFAAWREGMAENGLDPKGDFTQAMSDIVSEIADSEMQHLRDYALSIVESRANETLEASLARAEMWADRYQDVVNRAIIETAPKEEGGEPTRFIWIYNPEKEHCDTCAALNGVVATLEDWQASGYHPYADWSGKLPNDMLECGGWRCGCELKPTKEPLTEGGIPDLEKA